MLRTPCSACVLVRRPPEYVYSVLQSKGAIRRACQGSVTPDMGPAEHLLQQACDRVYALKPHHVSLVQQTKMQRASIAR